MGEGWGEGEKYTYCNHLASPSPLSPPTRGGERRLLTNPSKKTNQKKGRYGHPLAGFMIPPYADG